MGMACCDCESTTCDYCFVGSAIAADPENATVRMVIGGGGDEYLADTVGDCSTANCEIFNGTWDLTWETTFDADCPTWSYVDTTTDPDVKVRFLARPKPATCPNLFWGQVWTLNRVPGYPPTQVDWRGNFCSCLNEKELDDSQGQTFGGCCGGLSLCGCAHPDAPVDLGFGNIPFVSVVISLL